MIFRQLGVGLGAALAAAMVAMASQHAAGQCGGGWIHGPETAPPSIGGAVSSLVEWDPDGPGPSSSLIVASGSFTGIGHSPSSATLPFRSYLATWDGSSWRDLSIPGVSASGSALCVYRGELYAAPTSVSPNVFRWDGSAWSPLGGVLGGGFALALAVWNDRLVAGGTFATVGGLSASRIAMWDGTQWLTLGSGMNGTVASLTVFNGELIAAGSFSTAGGLAARGIARWDGTQWVSFGPNVTSSLSAFVGVYHGELIFAGSFSSIDGVPANSIAAWNGQSWHALGSGLAGLLPVVKAMAVQGDELVVGGSFSSAGGTPANRIARWNGTAWNALDQGVNATVNAMLARGGDLIVGGQFSDASGSGATRIARWDGQSWGTLGRGLATTMTSAVEFEGDLVLAAGRVYRWNGAELLPMGQALNGSAGTLSVINGELYLGGSFTGDGAVPLGGIARWDGAAWRPVGAGTIDGVGPHVSAIVAHEGEIVAVGVFSEFNGVAASNVATWDGSQWRALGAGVINTAYAIDGARAAASFGGRLFVGGLIDRAGDVPIDNVASWDGQAWARAGHGRSFNTVETLAVRHGQLYAGGSDANVAIGRWDGAEWVNLGLTYATVRAVDTYNGELIIAGNLNRPSLVYRQKGGDWVPLAESIDGQLYGIPASYAYALTTYHGELVVGGTFGIAGNLQSGSWARWSDTGIPWLARQPGDSEAAPGASAEFAVLPASGYANLTYQWRRNGVEVHDTPSLPGVTGVSGSTSATLRLSGVHLAARGVYDCVVASPCGSTSSQGAALVISPLCLADFNLDGAANPDDLGDFVTCYFSEPACPGADFNGDGDLNPDDLADYITAFFDPICG